MDLLKEPSSKKASVKKDPRKKIELSAAKPQKNLDTAKLKSSGNFSCSPSTSNCNKKVDTKERLEKVTAMNMKKYANKSILHGDHKSSKKRKIKKKESWTFEAKKRWESKSNL